MQDIAYTRHAKSRKRLYNIADKDVEATIEKPDKFDVEGSRYIALRHIENKYGNFPLKVVYVMEGEKLVVISTYPFKGKI